eukprot:TRINITY_DN1298_c0_g1_i6.p1 TRINITY_DN1298_c0_g1~~TRINITY_DN1298_c0_g1_i6.p1  ORF type:complete len:888 (+),score=57.49 TRINITY_DN1298_c0_g1_i6:284-2947(+)
MGLVLTQGPRPTWKPLTALVLLILLVRYTKATCNTTCLSHDGTHGTCNVGSWEIQNWGESWALKAGPNGNDPDCDQILSTGQATCWTHDNWKTSGRYWQAGFAFPSTEDLSLKKVHFEFASTLTYTLSVRLKDVNGNFSQYVTLPIPTAETAVTFELSGKDWPLPFPYNGFDINKVAAIYFEYLDHDLSTVNVAWLGDLYLECLPTNLCNRDSDCQTYGDLSATCSSNVPKVCTCSTGYQGDLCQASTTGLCQTQVIFDGTSVQWAPDYFDSDASLASPTECSGTSSGGQCWYITGKKISTHTWTQGIIIPNGPVNFERGTLSFYFRADDTSENWGFYLEDSSGVQSHDPGSSVMTERLSMISPLSGSMQLYSINASSIPITNAFDMATVAKIYLVLWEQPHNSWTTAFFDDIKLTCPDVVEDCTSNDDCRLNGDTAALCTGPTGAHQCECSAGYFGTTCSTACTADSECNTVDTAATCTESYCQCSSNYFGATCNTTLVPPDPPTSLASSSITAGSVVLSWAAPGNGGSEPVTNYQVYTDNGLGGTPDTKSILVNALTTQVAGLSPSTGYQFAVTAISKHGESPKSSSVSFTTLANSPPSAPDSPYYGALSPSSIDVAWEAPVSDGGSPVTGYKLYRDTTVDGNVTSLIATLGVVLSYSDTALSPTTTYEYSVSALNANGESGLSTASTETTTLGVPPDPPTGVGFANVTQSSLRVTWSAPADEGNAPITAYKIYGDTTVDGSANTFLSLSLGTSTEAVLSGLTASTTYELSVTAVSTDGESTFSTTNSTTTLAATVPSAPAAPTFGTVTSHSIVVNWNTPSNTGGTPITGYKVMSDLGSGGALSNTLATLGVVTTYTHTGGSDRQYDLQVCYHCHQCCGGQCDWL